jgi:hypothetical protein
MGTVFTVNSQGIPLEEVKKTEYAKVTMALLYESLEIFKEVLGRQDRVTSSDFDIIFGFILGDAEAHLSVYDRARMGKCDPFEVYCALVFAARRVPLHERAEFLWQLFGSGKEGSERITRVRMAPMFSAFTNAISRVTGMDRPSSETLERVVNCMFVDRGGDTAMSRKDFTLWHHEHAEGVNIDLFLEYANRLFEADGRGPRSLTEEYMASQLMQDYAKQAAVVPGAGETDMMWAKEVSSLANKTWWEAPAMIEPSTSCAYALKLLQQQQHSNRPNLLWICETGARGRPDSMHLPPCQGLVDSRALLCWFATLLQRTIPSLRPESAAKAKTTVASPPSGGGGGKRGRKKRATVISVKRKGKSPSPRQKKGGAVVAAVAVIAEFTKGSASATASAGKGGRVGGGSSSSKTGGGSGDEGGGGGGNNPFAAISGVLRVRKKFQTTLQLKRVTETALKWATTPVSVMLQECRAVGFRDDAASRTTVYPDQGLFNAIELLAHLDDPCGRLGVTHFEHPVGANLATGGGLAAALGLSTGRALDSDDDDDYDDGRGRGNGRGAIKSCRSQMNGGADQWVKESKAARDASVITMGERATSTVPCVLGEKIVGFVCPFDVARLIAEDPEVLGRNVGQVAMVDLWQQGLLSKPLTMTKDETVLQAFVTLSTAGASYAVILDERGYLAADICVDDLCEIVAQWKISGGISEGQVAEAGDFSELMSPVLDYQCKVNHPKPVVFLLQDSLVTAIEQLHETGRSQAYLTDDTGHPLAAFSLVDMLRVLLHESEVTWAQRTRRKSRSVARRKSSRRLISLSDSDQVRMGAQAMAGGTR